MFLPDIKKLNLPQDSLNNSDPVVDIDSNKNRDIPNIQLGKKVSTTYSQEQLKDNVDSIIYILQRIKLIGINILKEGSKI